MSVRADDDIEALAQASPMLMPKLRVKPLFEFSISMEKIDVDSEVMDLIMYGQSPGPHIELGQE